MNISPIAKIIEVSFQNEIDINTSAQGVDHAEIDGFINLVSGALNSIKAKADLIPGRSTTSRAHYSVIGSMILGAFNHHIGDDKYCEDLDELDGVIEDVRAALVKIEAIRDGYTPVSRKEIRELRKEASTPSDS